MQDPEMDMVNALFRAELQRFRGTDAALKRKVVELIVEAGALNWLLELTEHDRDPEIQMYFDIAQEFLDP
ncbi:MAG: hypothetical protein AAF125_03285 [Chloroflexota bacterium]